jgi:predicted SprT family Zn-dependent metalloprotease
VPTAYIKKLSKRLKKPVSFLEKKWDKAKKAAADQGHPEEFGYITSIFKKMVHASFSIPCVVIASRFVSSTSFKVGDIVLVRWGANEWYAGKVILRSSVTLKIQFYDESLVVNPAKEPCLVSKLERITDKEYTDADVLRLKLGDEDEDEDVPSVKFKNVPAPLMKMFQYAQDSDNPSYRLRVLEACWKWFNEVKFGSKMELPLIQLMKDAGTTFKRRGEWYSGKRHMRFSPRLFKSPFDIFAEIVGHEMCHQAVSEIDKVKETQNGGHGPHWIAWMIRVGLNPSRYDKNSPDTYMDEEEKHDYETQRVAVEKIRDRNAKERDLREGKPVQILVDGDLVEGVIVCRAKTPGKWAVLTVESAPRERWYDVPADSIYESEDPITIKPSWEVLMKKIRNQYWNTSKIAPSEAQMIFKAIKRLRRT